MLSSETITDRSNNSITMVQPHPSGKVGETNEPLKPEMCPPHDGGTR